MLFWIIGAMFTLGFTSKPDDDDLLGKICMYVFLWPLFLGERIQDYLKDNKDGNN